MDWRVEVQQEERASERESERDEHLGVMKLVCFSFRSGLEEFLFFSFRSAPAHLLWDLGTVM